jgi:TonB family protein
MLTPWHRRLAAKPLAALVIVTAVTTRPVHSQLTRPNRSQNDVFGVFRSRASEATLPQPGTRSGPEAIGVLQGRGYTSIVDGFAVTATATSDGLVEIIVGRDTSLRDFQSREPVIVRGFHTPAAVDEWLRGADSLRQAMNGDIPVSALKRSIVSMRNSDKMSIQASVSENATRQRHLSLSFATCRRPWFRTGHNDLGALPVLVANLAAAAQDARRLPNEQRPLVPDPGVYYEHAVGCAADPLPSNPAPKYPRVPAQERRRREVLARFIVDTTGLVEPASVQFLANEDPRFARAARATLARWRFSPATRRGVPVRQLSHASLAFDPPFGGVVEPGCAMTGRSGALVRPVTAGGARLDDDYLTHVARTFLIWFERPGVSGATARFVVRRNGTVSDQVIDREPPDAAQRADFTRKLRNVPFVLDPLPPSYPTDAVALEIAFVPECRSPRTAIFFGSPTTFTPLADGSIEIRNLHPSWGTIFDTREPPPARDVVAPNALRAFVDTAAILIPTDSAAFQAMLRRWPGNLAEIPTLGYRGNVGLRLALQTDGSLRGGIQCGETEHWMSVDRTHLAGFRRLALEAIASPEARAAVARRAVPANRVYLESEVACPAQPAVANEPVPYPASVAGDERTSRELLAALTVDTLGAVQPSSLTVFPGTDEAFAQAVRAVLPRWRFRAATRGGRRVRQRLHLLVVLRPPEADAAAIAAREAVVPDTSNRTIFFKRP